MRDVRPVKPSSPDPLAAELLTGLSGFPCAQWLVLGGYFALKHYCDYRPTHDIDAWWDAAAGEREKAQVRAVLQQVLTGLGARRSLELNLRRFGDTESWELSRAGKKVFSFQVSARTIQLAPYQTSAWPPLRIESLADAVASKMNALVQRGAPRDLLDVRQVVVAGLVSAADCWALWVRKNPDLDAAAARAEVARHLQELERRRPLDAIPDPAERARAALTRAWFRADFLALKAHAA